MPLSAGFWLGDLNYRIDRSIIDGKKRNQEHHVDEVLALVKRKDWAALAATDQLRQEMRRGTVFADWQEAALTFAPTFKLTMKYDDSSSPHLGEKAEEGSGKAAKAVVSRRRAYSRKRIPSYTDRIIW